MKYTVRAETTAYIDFEIDAENMQEITEKVIYGTEMITNCHKDIKPVEASRDCVTISLSDEIVFTGIEKSEG